MSSMMYKNVSIYTTAEIQNTKYEQRTAIAIAIAIQRASQLSFIVLPLMVCCLMTPVQVSGWHVTSGRLNAIVMPTKFDSNYLFFSNRIGLHSFVMKKNTKRLFSHVNTLALHTYNFSKTSIASI